MFESIAAKILGKLIDKGLAWLMGLAKLYFSIKKEKSRIEKERDATNDAVASLKKAKAEGRNPTPEEIKRLEDASYKLNSNFY